MAKKYFKYPSKVLLGALAIVMAYTIDNGVISGCFQTESLGYYQVVNRVTAAPLALISTPAGQLFLRRFSICPREARKKFYLMVSGAMLLIAIIIVLLLVLLAPSLPAILGKGWEVSGPMLLVTLPLFAARFTVSPVTSCALAMGREKAVMLWQIVMFLLSSAAAMVAFFSDVSLYVYLLVFGGLLGSGYILFWLISLRMIVRERKDDDR
jgi:O-antigen/teichoic acid export membrane protein